MGQIFISYRRSDASGHAGRLRDRLRAHFGQDVVFQDVDNIPDGEEFAKVIERALDSCKVALVVIGRNWINAQSTRGVRRFDAPDDWVRTEVGILLRRGIRVVPVLVQGAAMPRREDLPEELKDLAGRNARELRDSAWDADMSLLLKSLEPVLGSRRKRNLAVAAGIAAVAVAGLMYFGPYVDIRVGEVAVPDLEGKTVELAREALIRDGFKNVREETVPSADFGKGRVVRTEPAAGRPVAPSDRVTVFVSAGAPAATPSVAPPAPPSSPPATSDAKNKRPVTQEVSVAPRDSMTVERAGGQAATNVSGGSTPPVKQVTYKQIFMRECGKSASGMQGDVRTKFMSECLGSRVYDRTAIQEACVREADAVGATSPDARKAFLDCCLPGFEKRACN